MLLLLLHVYTNLHLPINSCYYCMYIHIVISIFSTTMLLLLHVYTSLHLTTTLHMCYYCGYTIHCNIHVLVTPPLLCIHVYHQEISPPMFTCSLDKDMSCELKFPHVDIIDYKQLILLHRQLQNLKMTRAHYLIFISVRGQLVSMLMNNTLFRTNNVFYFYFY